jgi:hypothetical protein
MEFFSSFDIEPDVKEKKKERNLSQIIEDYKPKVQNYYVNYVIFLEKKEKN